MRAAPRERFRVYTDAEFLADVGVGVGVRFCDGRRMADEAPARRRIVGVALLIGAIGSVGALTGAVLLAAPRHPRATSGPSVKSTAARVRSRRVAGGGSSAGADRSGLLTGRRPVRAGDLQSQRGSVSPVEARRGARPRSKLASRANAPTARTRPTAVAVSNMDAASGAGPVEPIRAAQAAPGNADSRHEGEFSFER